MGYIKSGAEDLEEYLGEEGAVLRCARAHMDGLRYSKQHHCAWLHALAAIISGFKSRHTKGAIRLPEVNADAVVLGCFPNGHVVRSVWGRTDIVVPRGA